MTQPHGRTFKGHQQKKKKKRVLISITCRVPDSDHSDVRFGESNASFTIEQPWMNLPDDCAPPGPVSLFNRPDRLLSATHLYPSSSPSSPVTFTMPLVYTFSRARPAALVNLFHNYSAADARSLHAALSPRDQDLKSSDTGATSSDILQQAEVKEWITTRQNAIRERQPNYAGWWTEILNYRQAPQTLPDPTLLLSGDHVFQGRPAVIAPSNTPTATEVKKGYANSLPSATSASPGNTLPTAASHGSTTFATGTVSSLSRSSTESTDYHGFAIPIKPSPPGAEDCCMR